MPWPMADLCNKATAMKKTARCTTAQCAIFLPAQTTLRRNHAEQLQIKLQAYAKWPADTARRSYRPVVHTTYLPPSWPHWWQSKKQVQQAAAAFIAGWKSRPAVMTLWVIWPMTSHMTKASR